MLAPATMNWTPAIRPEFPSRWPALCACALLLLLSGCTSTAAQQLATNLSTALVNQDDPALVRDGTPAHLLLLEGLLEGDPENEGLLLAAARMYGAYATLFVEDKERARSMAKKAHGYAARALCQRRPNACAAEDLSFDESRHWSIRWMGKICRLCTFMLSPGLAWFRPAVRVISMPSPTCLGLPR